MTKGGVVESREDARRVAALFQSKRDRIDGIIVSLPNFGDETGIVQTLELADLRVPVLVHAFDDDTDKVDVAHRRDAFCGKISVCNNLVQYEIPWTDTTEHTCAVDLPLLPPTSSALPASAASCAACAAPGRSHWGPTRRVSDRTL